MLNLWIIKKIINIPSIFFGSRITSYNVCYTKLLRIPNKNLILSHQEIQHKIRRIAYQIYETNVNNDEVILAGIEANGYLLAKKLKGNLDKISGLRSTLCKVIIDKKNPLSEVKTSIPVEGYSNKSVVLIDDVLNS